MINVHAGGGEAMMAAAARGAGTLHANSGRLALSRLESLIAEAPGQSPPEKAGNLPAPP